MGGADGTDGYLWRTFLRGRAACLFESSFKEVGGGNLKDTLTSQLSIVFVSSSEFDFVHVLWIIDGIHGQTGMSFIKCMLHVEKGRDKGIVSSYAILRNTQRFQNHHEKYSEKQWWEDKFLPLWQILVAYIQEVRRRKGRRTGSPSGQANKIF